MYKSAGKAHLRCYNAFSSTISCQSVHWAATHPPGACWGAGPRTRPALPRSATAPPSPATPPASRPRWRRQTLAASRPRTRPSADVAAGAGRGAVAAAAAGAILRKLRPRPRRLPGPLLPRCCRSCWPRRRCCWGGGPRARGGARRGARGPRTSRPRVAAAETTTRLAVNYLAGARKNFRWPPRSVRGPASTNTHSL